MEGTFRLLWAAGCPPPLAPLFRSSESPPPNNPNPRSELFLWIFSLLDILLFFALTSELELSHTNSAPLQSSNLPTRSLQVRHIQVSATYDPVPARYSSHKRTPRSYFKSPITRLARQSRPPSCP